jgi:hypothetical protein
MISIKWIIPLLFLIPLVGIVAADSPGDYSMPSYDIYNGTYSYFLFNLTHQDSSNSGHPVFEIYLIGGAIMAPIIAVWGYWVFLIVWSIYLITMWIKTGEVALPLVIGIISVGTWSMLFPSASYMFIGVMFSICLAVIIFKAFTDR